MYGSTPGSVIAKLRTWHANLTFTVILRPPHAGYIPKLHTQALHGGASSHHCAVPTPRPFTPYACGPMHAMVAFAREIADSAACWRRRARWRLPGHVCPAATACAPQDLARPSDPRASTGPGPHKHLGCYHGITRLMMFWEPQEGTTTGKPLKQRVPPRDIQYSFTHTKTPTNSQRCLLCIQ